MAYWYSSIEDIILTALAILVILILAWTIYSIVRAIIQFIFSNGDGEKIKKARNGIRYTIIGMVITILLLFFFPILFAKIGSQNSKAYSASSILERAMWLGRRILNTWSENSPSSPRTLDWWSSNSSYSENPL